jgi:hypothetical protein
MDGPGGGGGDNGPGYGQPGVVVLSYPTTYALPTITGDYTINTVSGQYVISFTAQNYYGSKTGSVEFQNSCDYSYMSRPTMQPTFAPTITSKLRLV